MGTTPKTIHRIPHQDFVKALIQNGITLFTMSACETASEDSNVVQYFIDKGGLYSYGFKKKVASVAAPILSENFYYQLFNNKMAPKDAFAWSETAVCAKVKQIGSWSGTFVYDQEFD